MATFTVQASQGLPAHIMIIPLMVVPDHMGVLADLTTVVAAAAAVVDRTALMGVEFILQAANVPVMVGIVETTTGAQATQSRILHRIPQVMSQSVIQQSAALPMLLLLLFVQVGRPLSTYPDLPVIYNGIILLMDQIIMLSAVQQTHPYR